MNCQISIEFFRALGKLSNSEQRQIGETLSKLVSGHQGSGLRPHKINHVSNKVFSYSPNKDVRIIAYRDGDSLTFLYVDHHDKAYEWAERRRIVQVGDAIHIVLLPESLVSDTANQLPPILSKLATSGEIPIAGSEVSHLATDDEVLNYLEKLPLAPEQKEAVLERVLLKSRSYRLLPELSVYTVVDDAELQEALKYPIDLWRVFLHPKQHAVAALPIGESALITGGPGTGKSVCLVHRAARLARMLAEDDVILFATYKESLSAYITEMLIKLGVDLDKVVLVDVVQLDEIEVTDVTKNDTVVVQDFTTLKQVWEGETSTTGCLLIRGSEVWFSLGNSRRRVRYLLVDECQDYRDRQLASLGYLTEKLPCTIAYDYTQSIYRPCPWEAPLLSGAGQVTLPITRLEYCYRLNRQIVKRIKAVVNTVRVLSAYAMQGQYKVRVAEVEEQLFNSLTSAIEGPPPATYTYQDETHLHELLRASLQELLKAYSPEDVVITTFMRDLYRNPKQSVDFGSEDLPDDLRSNYRYIYTLKGQEYKAGIVVLDEGVCQLLNLNHVLFTNKLPDGFRGDADNVRRMYNLLYVALSRFRDFLTILYPAKYAIVLDAIFRDIA